MSKRITLLSSGDARGIPELIKPEFDQRICIPLNAVQLAQERCESIARVLERKFDVDFTPRTTISHPKVRSVLVHKSAQLQALIPPIWKHRILTTSFQFRLGGTMYFGDGIYAISHPNFFDYSDTSDGGVRVLCDDEHQLHHAISMPMSEYLAAKGGDLSHRDLERHPIFQAILPDSELRRWYVTCLRILDHFSVADKGIQSLWRPGEMQSGYMRWIALGFKGVAVYPPNVNTRGHKIACIKHPSMEHLLGKGLMLGE